MSRRTAGAGDMTRDIVKILGGEVEPGQGAFAGRGQGNVVVGDIGAEIVCHVLTFACRNSSGTECETGHLCARPS